MAELLTMHLIPRPPWADEPATTIGESPDSLEAYHRYQSIYGVLISSLNQAVEGYVNDPTFSSESEDEGGIVNFPAREVMTGEYYIYSSDYHGELDLGRDGMILACILVMCLQKPRYIGHIKRTYLGLEVSFLLDLRSMELEVSRIDSSVWF